MAGLNGNPDSFHNLASLVENNEISCPPGWTAESLRQRAIELGSSNAKLSYAHDNIFDDNKRAEAIKYTYESFSQDRSDISFRFHHKVMILIFVIHLENGSFI